MRFFRQTLDRDLRNRVASVVIPLLVLCSMLALPVLASGQEVSGLQINSKRYIVIDAETGDVYAQKNAHEQVAFASLTKIFTATLAMDMAPLDTPITTEDFDLRDPDGAYFGTNGTVMGFNAGETYTLEDMIYGMLLPSGNDAANAIARTLGYQEGNTPEQAVQHFVDLMNQRIGDLGLKDTHLMNPHGWGVDGHYSTAWDIASFLMYARGNDKLVEAMGTRSYTTSNGAITITNTNRLLNEYDAIIGGKTGYDLDSGYCLVNIAGRDKSQMIAVTLDGVAPGDWYDDNRVLLEYGFEQHANLATGQRPFSGDIAGFTDPSRAEVGRAAEPGGSMRATSNRAVSDDLPANQPDVPIAEPRVDPGAPVSASGRFAERAATWSIVVVAVALVMIRGVISIRRQRDQSGG